MIAVCTAHDPGYAAMAAVTFPTVSSYCAKQDYLLYYHPTLEVREGDACKIRLFRDLYASGNFDGDDVFMWIDCDALVMNSTKSVEYIAAAHLRDAHVLYGQDPNGINTGVWMARFTSHADHFLRVAQETSLSMGWADQPGIFQTSLQRIFDGVVTYVPGKIFNAMPYELYGWDGWAHKNEINNYEPGDFILHLPGIEMPRRLDLLKHYAELAV